MLSSIYHKAGDRLSEKHLKLEETHHRVATHQVLELDTEFLPRRIDRLMRNPLAEKAFSQPVIDELKSVKGMHNLSTPALTELERVIGSADFLPVWFLSRGTELRRTVARVRARDGAGKDMKGTGFLVGPGLFLTNFHVLDWTDIGLNSLTQIIPNSVLEFDYEEDYNGRLEAITSFEMDPTTLLLTSHWDKLDYVLVAVKEKSTENGISIKDYGYNRLAGDLGKISKGEPVYIIQHPNGQPKQVVIQNNRLIERDEAYLTYEADTDSGSSGSPVFNRQWEVIALHHSPEIARDDVGNILAKNGSIWEESMGTSEVQFKDLNEGIRISSILDDLADKIQVIKNNGTTLNPWEKWSDAGLDFLNASLGTHLGSNPVDLVQNIPVERAPKLANHASSTFPNPD